MFNPAYSYASTATPGQSVELVSVSSLYGPLRHVESTEESTPPSAGGQSPSGAGSARGEARTEPNRSRTAVQQDPNPPGRRRTSGLAGIDGTTKTTDLTPCSSAGREGRTSHVRGNWKRTTVREMQVCCHGRSGSVR